MAQRVTIFELTMELRRERELSLSLRGDLSARKFEIVTLLNRNTELEKTIQALNSRINVLEAAQKQVEEIAR